MLKASRLVAAGFEKEGAVVQAIAQCQVSCQAELLLCTHMQHNPAWGTMANRESKTPTTPEIKRASHNSLTHTHAVL